jgi:hypothetical protein
MVSTASGALLIAGRHPGLAFQLSYDDGWTWKCCQFDTTFWANGFAYEIEPDRRKAIIRALATANKGDIVLIAGKGHEDYQIFKDRTVHFSDAEVIGETLRAMEAV